LTKKFRILQIVLTFALSKMIFNMKNNEEYTENRSRDWMVFIASTVGMLALLWFAPEWVWVAFPFQFTALAGAMGRL
jgi:hypothetical protein